MIVPDEANPPLALTRAAQGTRSTLLAQALRFGCKVISVPLLARLVSPADHGLFAMASSVVLLLALFRDFGLGPAAVQARTLNEDQLNALFWMHLLLGVGLTLATLALVPAAMWFFATPAVGPLLLVMSLAFLLIGAGGFSRSQLARELDFGAVNSLEATAAVVGTVAMIAAGAAGAGAYSFAAFLLVSEMVATLLSWRALRWRPRISISLRGLSGLLRTGGDLTAYRFLTYVAQQLDVFVVGRVFGAHLLGLYNRAGQLLALPHLHVMTPLADVTLAALSRLGTDSPHFTRHVCSAARTIAHLTLPLATVCIALPDEVVRLVLGPQWPEAAPMLRMLAISAAVSATTGLAYAVAVASGQTRRLAMGVAASLPFTVAALAIGLRHGPTAVATALAFANLILAGPRLWWSLRGSPVSVVTYGRSLIGASGAATAFGLGAVASAAFFLEESWILRLIVGLAGGAFATTVVVAIWPQLRTEWREVANHLPWARA